MRGSNKKKIQRRTICMFILAIIFSFVVIVILVRRNPYRRDYYPYISPSIIDSEEAEKADTDLGYEDPQVIDQSDAFEQLALSEETEIVNKNDFDIETYRRFNINDRIKLEINELPGFVFSEMPSFGVKYMSISEKTLRDLFSCQNKSDVASTIPIFVSNDGSTLTISATESIVYKTPDYDKYNYFLPIDDELNDMSNSFPNDKDLQFLSREDALTQITGTLSTLGITVAPNPRIITLDKESLNNAQSKLEHSMFWQTETASNRKKYKRSWTKEDECYAIVFEQSLDGFPVDAAFCRSVTDQTRFEDRVFALVGMNGIIGMKFTGLYSVLTREETRPTIAYKDAVESLIDFYNQNIFKRELCFVRAELKLVAIEEKKRIVIKPMWVFTSADNGASMNEINDRTFDNHLFLTRVYVDAYSGEVIVK